uniref:C3H1-type domain-containing protein n=1 Tax=Ditylenchus dipsaci TaxID=166011 RepID=A0A915EPF4_9BILA
MMRRGTKEMSKPLPKVALYKTQMCNSWNASQFCSYGNKCWFAHGAEELRHLPANVSRSVPATLHKHLPQSIDRVPTSGR